MLKSLKFLTPALLGTTAVLALSYEAANRMVPGPHGGGIGGLVTPAEAQEADAAPEADEAVAVDSGEVAQAASSGKFGLGRPALEEEIVAWDIDVRPDGAGLPEGSGDVATGEEIYTQQCSVCHGTFGEGSGRWPVLSGGEGTLEGEDPVKTTGSYWPYLSTVFDYVHRAMPFGNAQSLTDDEVYAVTAYIMNLNFLVEDDFVLSRETFLDVEMPNAEGFAPDDRPETELPRFSQEACMSDCKTEVEITMHAAVLDVTPEDGGGEQAELAAAAEVATEQPSTTVEGAAEIGTEDAGDGTADPSSDADAPEGAAPETEAAAEPQTEAALDPELVEAGEKVFRKCKACHQVGEGAKNRVGPQLNDLMGQPIGGKADFAYSSAFEEAHGAGQTWTADSLSAFLEDPRGTFSGTKMSFSGLKKEDDRAAVIEYLRSFEGVQ